MIYKTCDNLLTNRSHNLIAYYSFRCLQHIKFAVYVWLQLSYKTATGYPKYVTMPHKQYLPPLCK